MSDGLEQVPKNDYSSKVRAPYAPQEQVFASNSEKIVKNSLSIDRNPPAKSQTYQETADPCFESIDKDYKQSNLGDKKMKGRGSKRLKGFPVILWKLEAFIKWVKAESKRVAFEVFINRLNQDQENRWFEAKKAFKTEFDRLNQQRQAP